MVVEALETRRWRLALLSLLVAGCSPPAAESDVKIAAARDLVGRKCSVVVGSMMADMTLGVQPGIGFDWFNDYNSGIEAVRLKKVDGMPLDRFYARRWALEEPATFAITEPYGSIPWGFFFAKGNPLRERVNGVLKAMRESGELKRLLDKWTEAEDPGTLPLDEPASPSFTGAGGVLRFATPGDREPVCFVRPGGYAGFDVDIVRHLAARLNLRLEFVQVSMGAMVNAVQAGKADMGGGGIAITAERAEQVDFSECYYRVPTVFLIRRSSSAEAAGAAAPPPAGAGGFLASLKASFMRTFVVEDRWRLMASGLGVTALITLAASLLGTLLAFPVWWARSSASPALAWLARGYVAALQGTPVLVLLMVLYYLVFGQVDLDAVIVAILAFAFNASAYIGEALRSGVAAVPPGQMEAALALGYSRHRAFRRFVLPQALKTIMPVYRGIIVNLLKSTSVVGYIAITDLNKASDLVRSRTYESFFPLLTTAFIYFVAAWLLAAALDALARRLDPAWRRAHGKGVRP